MYIGKMETQPAKINIASINRSAKNKYQAIYGKSKESKQTDDVSISPAGKKQGMLKQLMDQKQRILEQKQSMLDSDQANGSESMNDKLKEFEMQLKAIDDQIAQIQADESDKSEPYFIDETGKIYKKPKSKEDAQAEQMSAITKISSGVSQAEVISSAKAMIDGKINVLKSEIKQGYGNTDQKIEAASRLQSRSDQLAAKTSEKMGEINKTAAAMTNNATESTDTETETEPETEKVTGSQSE
ncbi:hypothetical protein [Lacrimispora defluvii]|uniref:Uncharacterized protein n=1 Tax=Lacrimispora defluvii TaxID=2719233 RepID=A0ABX1VQP1_9FIRM|nr:hypothetical protein [Lacrimispora defluvii]NNJ30671.1 hypothetical protein [Lacrimispora defluvii]